MKVSREELIFWSSWFYTATTFSEEILFQQRYFYKRDTFSHGDIILNTIVVLLLSLV